eukprot:TRINITY_DN786_c0_g1_i1.p1 TRINITY_DN786_c0_g1~~TRINITY_DN786_c0_g1_i1.p1  ORF type:complete len:887 (-),score=215.12 TRINITY_DN786_c0_g1_i1:55-2715(-)
MASTGLQEGKSLFNEAIAKQKIGHHADATELLTKAIEKLSASQLPLAYFVRATSLHHSGELLLAVVDYSKARELQRDTDPLDYRLEGLPFTLSIATVLFNRALALAALGYLQRALVDLATAEKTPGGADIKTNIDKLKAQLDAASKPAATPQQAPAPAQSAPAVKPPPISKPASLSTAAKYVCWVRATFDYAAQEPEELSFKENDVFGVTEKTEPEGWWEGELRGKKGQFPSNFVEETTAPIPAKPASADVTPPSPATPKPATPTSDKPSTPTSAKPAAPAVAKPALPTTDKPAPAKPAAPVMDKPAPAKPAAPVIDKPAPAKPAAAPVIDKPAPAKPTVDKPAVAPPVPAAPIQPQTTKYVCWVKAIYDYAAQEPEELSFKENDVFGVTEKTEPEGWWAGELGGKKGQFPSNFVEETAAPVPAKPAVSPSLKPVLPPAESKPSAQAAKAAPVVAKVEPKIIKPAPSPVKAPEPASTPKYVCWVRATFDYDAQEQAELSFKENDVFGVIEKTEPEGWWEGELRGKKGQFPSNFVEETAAPASAAAMKPPSSAATEPAAPKSTPPAVSAPPSKPAPPAPAQPEPPKYESYAKAQFDYDAQEDGELSFKENDVIGILSKPEAEGWWEGELGGKKGVFPSNYVTPCEAPAAAAKKRFGAPGGGGINVMGAIAQAMPADPRSLLRKSGAAPVPEKPSAPAPAQQTDFRAALKPRGGAPTAAVAAAPTAAPVPTAPKSEPSIPPPQLATPPVPAAAPTPSYVCWVKASFDYDASEEGELSFKEGQVFGVVSQPEPEGWWEGELGGKRGQFPSNFVEKTDPPVAKPAPKLPPPKSVPAKPATTGSVPRPMKMEAPTQQPAGDVPPCATCGCSSFTPHAFKKGQCNKCFHPHV